MTLTVNDVTVAFDPALTRGYYQTHTVCDCCDDRNYQQFVKDRFPGLDRFLSQFGVDISRPDETASVYLDDRDAIQYLFAAYTVVGRITAPGRGTLALDGGETPVEVSICNDYYPNEQTGEYFTIVATGIVLPWLLDGEYPDKH